MDWTPEESAAYVKYRVAMRAADGNFARPEVAEAFSAFKKLSPRLLTDEQFTVPAEVEEEIEKRLAEMEAERPFQLARPLTETPLEFRRTEFSPAADSPWPDYNAQRNVPKEVLDVAKEAGRMLADVPGTVVQFRGAAPQAIALKDIHISVHAAPTPGRWMADVHAPPVGVVTGEGDSPDEATVHGLRVLAQVLQNQAVEKGTASHPWK